MIRAAAAKRFCCRHRRQVAPPGGAPNAPTAFRQTAPHFPRLAFSPQFFFSLISKNIQRSLDIAKKPRESKSAPQNATARRARSTAAVSRHFQSRQAGLEGVKRNARKRKRRALIGVLFAAYLKRANERPDFPRILPYAA